MSSRQCGLSHRNWPFGNISVPIDLGLRGWPSALAGLTLHLRSPALGSAIRHRADKAWEELNTQRFFLGWPLCRETGKAVGETSFMFSWKFSSTEYLPTYPLNKHIINVTSNSSFQVPNFDLGELNLGVKLPIFRTSFLKQLFVGT